MGSGKTMVVMGMDNSLSTWDMESDLRATVRSALNRDRSKILGPVTDDLWPREIMNSAEFNGQPATLKLNMELAEERFPLLVKVVKHIAFKKAQLWLAAQSRGHSKLAAVVTQADVNYVLAA